MATLTANFTIQWANKKYKTWTSNIGCSGGYNGNSRVTVAYLGNLGNINKNSQITSITLTIGRTETGPTTKKTLTMYLSKYQSFSSKNTGGYYTGGDEIGSWYEDFYDTTEISITLKSGTFFDNLSTALKNGKRYFTFYNDEIGSTDNWSKNYMKFNSLSIKVEYTNYTKCTAPTFSEVPSIISKYDYTTDPTNGYTTLKIRWNNDGTSGQLNNITGYRLYYGTNSNPTTVYGKYDYDSSKNIYEVTINTQTYYDRGAYIYCAIQTIGTVEGYDSDLIISNGVLINSLPSTPTVTSTTQTLPSAGGSTTFTVSATDANNQDLIYYYKVSSSEDWNRMDETEITIDDIKSTTKYYFKVSDGLEECSTAAEYTITVNTKPTLSLSGTDTTKYSAKLSDQAYVINSILAGTTNKSSGTITWNFYYSDIGSNDFTLKTFTDTVSTTTTSRAFNANELIQAAGKRWYIQATYNDGIEDSDTEFYPSSGYYYLASNPTNGATYNTFSNSNINNSIGTDYFYNKIRVYFTSDTDITNVASVYYKLGSSGTNTAAIITAKKIDGSSNTNTNYIDITTPNNLTANSTYTFTVNLTNGYFTKSFSFTKKQAPVLAISNLVGSTTSVNAYTGSGTSGISFGCSGLASTEDLKTYCYEPNNWLKLSIGNSSEYINKTFADLVFNSTNGVSFNMSVVDIANLSDGGTSRFGLNIKELYYKKVAVNYKIQLTDIFERVQTLIGNTLEIDFSSILSITPLCQLIDGISYININIDETVTLQQGMQLKFTSTLTDYNYKTGIIKLLISKDGGISWSENQSSNLTIEKTDLSLNKQTAEASFSLTIGPISSASNTWQFELQYTENNTGEIIKSNIYEFNVYYITTPTLTISSYSYDTNNNKLTLGYVYSSGSNHSNILSNNLILNVGETNITISLNDLSTSGTISQTVASSDIGDNWTSAKVYFSGTLNYTQTISGLTFTQTRELSADYVLIYNLAPTVAYRQNHLGINNNNFKATDVFVVQQSNDRKIIRFISAENEITIDLSTGEFGGIIIDGGSWDIEI